MADATVIDLRAYRRDTEPAPPPARHPLVLTADEGFVLVEFGSPPDLGPFTIELSPGQATELAHDLLRMATAAEAAR